MPSYRLSGIRISGYFHPQSSKSIDKLQLKGSGTTLPAIYQTVKVPID
jgi:hypothetical protein